MIYSILLLGAGPSASPKENDASASLIAEGPNQALHATLWAVPPANCGTCRACRSATVFFLQ